MTQPSLCEIDCPACGIDYDLEPPPGPGGVLPACACGYQYTVADMRTANFYDGHMNIVANPFKGAI